MDYWYLVSSLPGLRFGDKPAMSIETFRSACFGELTEEQLNGVDAALENRAPDSALASAWWNGEVQLRDAVVRVRAKSRSTDASRFLKPHDGFSATLEEMVTDAFTRATPMEQEMDLDRTRWTLVDELALARPFGFEGVLAYAVKLRIAERWAGMDDEAGQEKVEEWVLSALEEPNNE